MFSRTRYGLRDGKILMKEVIEYLEIGERSVVEKDTRLSTVPNHPTNVFLASYSDPLVAVGNVNNSLESGKQNTVYGVSLLPGVVEISEGEYNRRIAGGAQ